MIHLAARYPRPQVIKKEKEGWLSADRYINLLLSSIKVYVLCSAESKEFDGSHSYHHFVGLCTDKSKSEKDGPLHARKMFCAYYACTMLKFANAK